MYTQIIWIICMQDMWIWGLRQVAHRCVARALEANLEPALNIIVIFPIERRANKAARRKRGGQARTNARKLKRDSGSKSRYREIR